MSSFFSLILWDRDLIWSGARRVNFQKYLLSASMDTPVVMMNPIIQSRIRTMVPPTPPQYSTINALKGMPVMPPEETALPKKW